MTATPRDREKARKLLNKLAWETAEVEERGYDIPETAAHRREVVAAALAAEREAAFEAAAKVADRHKADCLRCETAANIAFDIRTIRALAGQPTPEVK